MDYNNNGFGSTETALQASEDRFRLLVDSVRDYAIFMLDPGGHVISWNAGAERFNGYKAEEITGSHVSRLYPPEALARGLPRIELETAAREGTFEDEGWRVRKDGSLYWANVVVTAMRDDACTLVGFAKITRDLTERRNHEEALRRSEERFRLLVEGVSDYAIFMLDVNGRVATWNVGAQRIKGYAANEIIGKHFSVFYPEDVRASGWPEHELKVATEQGRFVDKGWRVRKDGTQFWALVTITAVRDRHGKLVGFAKLTRDMTDSMRMEEMEEAHRRREEVLDAERNARIAAQRATRIKDEFLATLSHELRTPLSAIIGWTQVLQKAEDSGRAADVARAVDVIDRNARIQIRLIDDLLDLNRIMTGKLRLETEQVSVATVVQAAVDATMPAARSKGVDLHVLLTPEPLRVSGDGSRLQQIAWNLLQNAIKFTPPGGRVDVELRRVDDQVELQVRDTGIGIPESFLPHVFERFSQQDGSASRVHGGLGLGLAISRQLVELHGGQIEARSAGTNQGATFTVRLPLSVFQAEEERAERLLVDETRASENQALPRLDGMYAYVVDDEDDARELICRILADQGAKVSAFSCAQDLLDALQTSRPTVVISDIGMPKMDGFQMIKALRATEPAGSRVPALALTAFARPEDRKQALLAGFQGHLAKPFDAGELILLVKNLVV